MATNVQSSYLRQLHDAHEARKARFWPKQTAASDQSKLHDEIRELRSKLQDRDTTIGLLKDKISTDLVKAENAEKRRKARWRASWHTMINLATWVDISDRKSVVFAAQNEQRKQEAAKIKKPISVAEIAEQVCKKYGLDENDVCSARRDWAVMQAKFEIYYRASRETPHSLPSIGRMLGKKHHTTVLYGRNQYEAWMKAKAAGLPIPSNNNRIIPELILELAE